MSNHTGAVAACQTQSHIPRSEITPSPPPPETIDRRLVLRYGAWLLTGGYTAIPTYAWVYYARLGVSEAEMVLIAQLCTYWWSARDPYPGEAVLAARMGKTIRTIQGYLRSLEAKGLLHIHTRLSTNGRQSTNAYDLRPFFMAVEGLARLDGLLPADDAGPATPATPDNDSCNVGPFDHNDRKKGTAEREPLCAETAQNRSENTVKGNASAGPRRDAGSRAAGMKNPSPQVNPIEIENFDLDSIPPTPAKATRTPTDAETRPPASAEPDDQAIAAEIAALSAALGDDAPRSSLSRARNLCRDAGVSPARFLCLLDEAAARTRDRQASIVNRRRDGLAVNGMPYLFAVLQDLMHPAPSRVTDGGPDPARRRAGVPDRRRRRRDAGRSMTLSSPALYFGGVAPAPITEINPTWRTALEELASVLTPENFNTWLATTRVLTQDDNLLRVAVVDDFHHMWLDRRLRGIIERVLARIMREVRVEFIVVQTA